MGSSRPGILLLLALERIFIVLIRSNNSRRGDVWGGFRQVSHFCAFARISKPPRTQNIFPTLASRPVVRSQSVRSLFGPFSLWGDDAGGFYRRPVRELQLVRFQRFWRFSRRGTSWDELVRLVTATLVLGGENLFMC